MLFTTALLKKLWQIVNEVRSKNIDKTSAIEYLKIGNIHEYNAGKISNHLGNYFSKVGKTFANKIPNSNKGTDYYLNKIIGNTSSIMLSPACEREIERILDKLPSKNSSGYDNISNVLLKRLKPIVVPIVCKLCNVSLSNGFTVIQR